MQRDWLCNGQACEIRWYFNCSFKNNLIFEHYFWISCFLKDLNFYFLHCVSDFSVLNPQTAFSTHYLLKVSANTTSICSSPRAASHISTTQCLGALMNHCDNCDYIVFLVFFFIYFISTHNILDVNIYQLYTIEFTVKLF